MYCTNCGKEFDGKFCPECGTKAIHTDNLSESTTPKYVDDQSVAPVPSMYSGDPDEFTGQKKPKKKNPGCLIAIGVTIALLFFIGIIGSLSSNDVPSNSSNNNDNPSVQSQSMSNDTIVGDSSPKEENIPTEYKSALKKAESYSELMHMSKSAIYDQLVSEYGEQFSAEAAQYAIDNLIADWNANALEKAKTYSETMFMSKAAIYDQLVSEHGERFTAEEAQYAVDTLAVDYKENALQKAKSYQDSMAMSPSAIYEQLTSEYGEQFTAEEAQYAIDNLE